MLADFILCTSSQTWSSASVGAGNAAQGNEAGIHPARRPFLRNSADRRTTAPLFASSGSRKPDFIPWSWPAALLPRRSARRGHRQGEPRAVAHSGNAVSRCPPSPASRAEDGCENTRVGWWGCRWATTHSAHGCSSREHWPTRSFVESLIRGVSRSAGCGQGPDHCRDRRPGARPPKRHAKQCG